MCEQAVVFGRGVERAADSEEVLRGADGQAGADIAWHSAGTMTQPTLVLLGVTGCDRRWKFFFSFFFSFLFFIAE
jgi:hypothetical protein